MANGMRLLSAGVITGSALCIATAAHSQTASAPVQTPKQPSNQSSKQATAQTDNGEAIVVTAQKRAQRLLDVPISISAYTSETMQRRGIQTIADLAAVTPGLNFLDNASVYSRTTIRGVATDSGNSTGVGTATTAIYVDDAPIQPRAILGFGGYTTAYPKVFDFERVEVLRGPQGTLFGSSSMGGTIRFISPEPSLTTFTGYARGEIAQGPSGGLSYESGVAVGGPIVEDRVGFRVSGWQRHDGGYIDRESSIPGGAVEKNSNSNESYSGRAAITFAPVEDLKVTASVYAQRIHENDTSRYFPSASSGDHFVITDPLREPTTDRFILPELKINYNAGGVTLTSVTTYFDRQQSQNLDYTNLVPPLFGAPLPTSLDQYEKESGATRQKNFTQELRLASSQSHARLQWTLGAYYSQMKQHAAYSIEAPGFPAFIQSVLGVPIEQVFGVGLYQGLYSFYETADTKDTEIAAFANAELRVTSGLSLLGGVRVSRLKEDFHSIRNGPFAGGTVIRSNNFEETPVTPKVGINYKPSENVLIYASAAKGFRAGGVNQPLLVVSDQCVAQAAALGTSNFGTYKSDSLWSYEMGMKNRLFGGRVNFDGSVYQIDWNKIQRRVQVPACGDAFVANFGSARVRGFEASVDAVLTKGLTALLTVGYNHSVYSKNSEANGVLYALKGDQISEEHPLSVTAALQYERRISNQMNGYVRVEERYLSKNHGSFSELNPNTAIFNPFYVVPDAVNLLNVKMGATIGGFDISIFANNLLNKHPILFRTDNRNDPLYGAATLRRMVGVTGSYRW